MTPLEHAARAMLLGKHYDAYTNSYRGRSPEGSNYTYSGSVDADTLEPFKRGELLARELEHFGHSGKKNTVSNVRLGLA